MHVDSETYSRNGKTYTRHLLRKSYREGGKPRKKTIANISDCSDEEIAALRLALKHKGNLTQLGPLKQTVKVVQGLSIGSIWLLNAVAERLGIAAALGKTRQGRLALWQIFARVIAQGSRLSAAGLASSHAVNQVVGLKTFDEDDLYENLDWLSENQERIEESLSERRNQEGSKGLYFYDVTSSYLEGNQNELSGFGYNRDGKSGKRQIVVGLLCDGDGRPLSIEVFPGNTSDLKTFSSQVKKAANRFGAKDVTFVGDRGMIKNPQIAELKEHDLHYVTAITKAQIETLLKSGVLQLSLFDETVSEVQDADGVRYVLRRNPTRAAEIAKTRTDKLETVRQMAEQATAYLSEHSRARELVALRKIKTKIERLKLSSWVRIVTGDRSLTVVTDDAALQEISKLDGCYVVKSDVPGDVATAQELHDRYKDLSKVEWAFREFKTVHLELRPIFVRKESRTRGHALVIMLSYLITKELHEYWRELSVGVQDGLQLLDTVCLAELTIADEKKIPIIPTPRPDIAALFKSANVALPKPPPA